MPKSRKRILKIRKNNKTKNNKTKNNRKMKGGAYTPEQKQQLLNAGFTPFFIKLASNNKIGYNILWTNFQQSFHEFGKTAEQYMNETYEALEINPDDGLTDVESSDSEDEDEDEEQNGGKRRRRTKTIKTKKTKRSRRFI